MSNKEELIRILRVPIYPLEGADPVEVVADYLIDNDVVKIVRCEKCTHNESSICQNDNVNVCWYWGRATTADGYCDRGVERGDE